MSKATFACTFKLHAVELVRHKNPFAKGDASVTYREHDFSKDLVKAKYIVTEKGLMGAF